MAGERILVVEDSRDLVEFIRDRVLAPMGYSVMVAMDGYEGLELARRTAPSLVLLDVNLPNLTGLEILQRLRTANNNVPVILMTSYGSEEIAVQALRLGVRDYVRKPFDTGEMRMIIDRALAEQRLEAEKQRLEAALANANARLKQQLREQELLYTIGRSVASALDIEELMPRVAQAAAHITSADEALLFLIEPERKALRLQASAGPHTRIPPRTRFPLAGSPLERMVQSERPHLETNPLELPVAGGLLERIPGPMAYASLRSGQEVLGLLAVHNSASHRALTQETMRQLATLADYASLALQNARLYARARRLAAVEALQQTVVTLAHHINNPLTSLLFKAQTLEMQLEDQATSVDDTRQSLRTMQAEVEKIAAVIAILRGVTDPQSTVYAGSTRMIDIEQELERRIRDIDARYA